MKTTGRYQGSARSLDGKLTITFEIDGAMNLIDELEEGRDQRLMISTRPSSKDKTLLMNNYFWELCTKIAQSLHEDKDTIYRLKLSEHTEPVGLRVKEEAIPDLMRKAHFRHCVIDEYLDDDLVEAHFYYGISTMDRKEFLQLIDDVVADCHLIGVDPRPDEETAHVLALWKGEMNGIKRC